MSDTVSWVPDMIWCLFVTEPHISINTGWTLSICGWNDEHSIPFNYLDWKRHQMAPWNDSAGRKVIVPRRILSIERTKDRKRHGYQSHLLGNRAFWGEGCEGREAKGAKISYDKLHFILLGILPSSHSVNSSSVSFSSRQASRFCTASYCHCLNFSFLRLPVFTLAKYRL